MGCGFRSPPFYIGECIMAKIDLKTLLDNYTSNLCGKIFKYAVLNRTKKTNDAIIIRFYNENLCHLLGLQHVYDNSTKYLGESGYNLINEGKLTTKSLKQHNEKGFNFIKIKLKHFDEIYDIMVYGKLIRFNPDKVFPRTYITADFMLIKDNTTYILHLFLRRENQNSSNYAPVSFVIHTSKDDRYNQFINNQEYKKIVDFEEIKVQES